MGTSEPSARYTVRPSWQARCLRVAMRVLMRRLTWGDEVALAGRARRVFGAPGPWQWLRTRDARIEPVHDRTVHGEWIYVDGDGLGGVILYFHGGGYVACSPATDRPITAGLARLAGRRVFSVDYRLAPEHRFPAAVDDAVAAYRWLLDRGTVPHAVALAGTSAGGGLALATVVRVRDEHLPLPACAMLFSPWTDLEGTGASLSSNDGRCPTFRPANIPAFARIYLGGASPRHPYASPVFADLRGLPPILLQASSNELLVDDALRVHEKISLTGGVSRLEIFDDLFHAWPMLDGFMPEARLALRQAAAFIDGVVVT